MKDIKTEIKLGTHLANSHVYINGQEIPVTSIEVMLNQESKQTEVKIGLLPYKLTVEGEFTVDMTQDAGEIIEELILKGKKIYAK